MYLIILLIKGVFYSFLAKSQKGGKRKKERDFYFFLKKKKTKKKKKKKKEEEKQIKQNGKTRPNTARKARELDSFPIMSKHHY